MRFTAEVVPLSVGSYGPFSDDDEGRVYPFVNFTGSDGGDVLRATGTVSTDLASIPLMVPVVLDFELHTGDSKLKLRTFGRVPSPTDTQAA